MKIITLLASGLALVAANATAQPVAGSHEQHQASGHQALGQQPTSMGERCCCEEMMRKMMSEMMQKQQGMNMPMAPNSDQPKPDERPH